MKERNTNLPFRDQVLRATKQAAKTSLKQRDTLDVGGWGLWEMCTVCSVIQTHQSMCFCSLEHIPWILLGFVPLNLQRNGLSPAELSEAASFKHRKNMQVTTHKQFILVSLLYVYGLWGWIRFVPLIIVALISYYNLSVLFNTSWLPCPADSTYTH